MGVRRFAACGAVEDALAGEAVEALDREMPPCDAACEDDRPRPQDVAAVEVHLTRRGIDARDRPGDEDLGAEPACLLERPARQLVAGDTRREAEVVLDPRGRARLAAGRLALDHDRPKALGRAVHGGCEAGRPRADDHRVVLRGRRLGRDVEQLGNLPQLRSHDRGAVDHANRGVVALGRQRAPLLRVGGHVRLEPFEPDLVAVEEAPELRAGGVPAMAEDDRPERGGRGRARLQALRPAEPVGRQEGDPLPDLRRCGGERLVVVQLDPEHARRLRRAEPAGWSIPNAIDISPKTSPGFRSPTTLSTPSTTLSTSNRPSSTPNSARASPSCTANSPGTSVMSATTRASRSRSAGSRSANTAT